MPPADGNRCGGSTRFWVACINGGSVTDSLCTNQDMLVATSTNTGHAARFAARAAAIRALFLARIPARSASHSPHTTTYPSGRSYPRFVP